MTVEINFGERREEEKAEEIEEAGVDSKQHESRDNLPKISEISIVCHLLLTRPTVAI